MDERDKSLKGRTESERAKSREIPQVSLLQLVRPFFHLTFFLSLFLSQHGVPCLQVGKLGLVGRTMLPVKYAEAALGHTKGPSQHVPLHTMAFTFMILSVFCGFEVQAIASCKRGSCNDMPLWRCFDQFLSGCNENEEAYVFTGRGLSGTIPLWLSSLSNAQNIYLDGNQLTGTIPDIFDQLPLLESFDVARNLLTGVPPASLCDLRRISHCALRQHSSDVNSFSCLGLCPGACVNVGCFDVTTPQVAVQDVCSSTMPCSNLALAECAFLSCPNGTAAASLPPRLILSDKRIYGTIPHGGFAGVSQRFVNCRQNQWLRGFGRICVV